MGLLGLGRVAIAMSGIVIKTTGELERMREAGRIVGLVLGHIGEILEPGMSTLLLDREAERIIRGEGAEPSFLGYGQPPFPASICASINEEVVHGIPSADRILREGDVISIDVGAYIDGFHGDAARTFPVGEVSEDAMDLMRATHDAFWAAYYRLERAHQSGERLHVRDLSEAIENVADERGYGVFKELTGHGIGHQMHEAPEILNFTTLRRGSRITTGMGLAVEPMFAASKNWRLSIEDDGWTCTTRDGSLASHYENTILVFPDHLEVSTLPSTEEAGEFYL